MNNYISAVKRVNPYTLVSGDISLTTALAGYDYISILAKADSNRPASSSILYNGFIVEKFNKYDTASNIVSNLSTTETVGMSSSGVIYITVPKGTYANLAAAQTALAGTKIIYQLATPVFIPYEDFDKYSIVCDGALASHSGYTNVSYEGDIVPDVSVTYAMDLGAGISSVKDSTATALSLATETYNIIDQDWQSWTPTLTWTGTPPLTPTTVAKYKQIGSTVHFNLSITSTDGNGATALTITLPIAPKVNSTTISLNAQEKVNTTWTNPLAYIVDSGSLIQFRSFSTATDNVALEVLVSGSYEVV